MHRKNKNQSGSAIVAVLLIVAIISIIAAALIVQQRIDIRRTQQIQTANKAYRYSQAALYWAAGEILSSANENPLPDGQLWEKDFPNTLVAQFRGKMNGHLERLDQRINLNSFGQQTTTTTQQDLVKLVSSKNPEISENKLMQIMQSVGEWISPDPAKSDSYYLGLNPPYRAAHIPMASPSELRLVVGVEANILNHLIPYIITLPTSEAKNRNYYLLTTEVALDDQNLRVYSILYLDSDSTVRVWWSTLGTW